MIEGVLRPQAVGYALLGKLHGLYQQSPMAVAGVVDVRSGSEATSCAGVKSSVRWLTAPFGAITPLGGASFLAGWLVLTIAALRQPTV